MRIGAIGIAAAIAIAGAAVGGVVAYADSGSPQFTATASVAPTTTHPAVTKRVARIQQAKARAAVRRFGIVGKVTQVSGSGGMFGQGQLVVTESNGKSVTFSLSNLSHAWRVQGAGQPPTAESPTTLPVGELVVVRPAQVVKGQYWAAVIADSGFKAA